MTTASTTTLFLAETHYDLETLEAELINLFSSEADKQAVSLFLNWFRQMASRGRIDPEDYQSMEYTYFTCPHFNANLPVLASRVPIFSQTHGYSRLMFFYLHLLPRSGYQPIFPRWDVAFI